MEWLPQLVVVVLVAAAAWYLYRPPAVFVVRIRAGRPTAAAGVVTPAFLAVVAEVCAECRVRAGEVRGVRRGRRVALRFSPGLPHSFRQRLRNWWVNAGWSAGPRRA